MQVTVPFILPLICLWAKRHEAIILKTGVALSVAQLTVARKLGIREPERVRLLAVQEIPPRNGLLCWIGEKIGLNPSQTIGMTLRYGIYICSSHWGDRRLLVHELAHVAQYERKSGFYGFMKQYVRECIDPGYPLGEMEQEAKRAEAAFG